MIAVNGATGRIKIDEVDEDIFSRKYFAHCLDCRFCEDMCCSYGCQVDAREKAGILVFARKLEADLRLPSLEWFEAETITDPDYPSGKAVRTRVYSGKCVFYDHALRGCTPHKFAQEKGLDRHLLKPMVCSLFPIGWEQCRLFVSSFLDELPCKDRGISAFEAQKGELRIYFGPDLVSELEGIALSKNVVKIAPNPLT